MAVKTTVNNWSWKIEGWGLESCFVKLTQLFRAGIQVQSPCLIFAVCPSSDKGEGQPFPLKYLLVEEKGTSHPFSYGECCTVYIQYRHHMKWLAPQKNTSPDCTAKMLKSNWNTNENHYFSAPEKRQVWLAEFEMNWRRNSSISFQNGVFRGVKSVNGW